MSDPAARRLANWVEKTTGLTEVRLGPVIAGGNSNITRLVETNSGRLVLRHPPVVTVSDKAGAGIAREYTALKTLFGQAPVAEPVAWCDDPAILGQPFSLTRYIEGATIRDVLPATYGAGPGAVNAIGLALVEALGAVHRVDPEPMIAAGLCRTGGGFVKRQIERWRTVRGQDQVRDLPKLEAIADWLDATAPQALPGRIVHCDYHLDNCLADPDRPAIRAILDWEMATVADPRLDLGLVLFFWCRNERSALGFPWIQAFSNRDDAIGRADLADAWSAAARLPASDLHYFIAFAAWRLAAIVEGAYVLFRNGKIDSAYARALEHDVPAILDEVAAMIEHEAV